MLNVWTMLSIWLASLQVISAPNMCSHNTSVLNDIWWSLWAVHHTASCNCTMWKKRPYHYHYHSILHIPSRELTYPTWGKGKSSSKVPWKRDMLVPWRVFRISPLDSDVQPPPTIPPSHRSHGLEPNRGESRLHNSNLACRRGAWSHSPRFLGGSNAGTNLLWQMESLFQTVIQKLKMCVYCNIQMFITVLFLLR